MNVKRIRVAGLAILLLIGLQCLGLAAGSAWLQNPNMYRGYQYSSETKIPSVVADDWVYTGDPIIGIRWWGGYWSPVAPWHYGYYSDGRPSVATTVPCHWQIAFYENIPADGNDSYPQPGNQIARYTFEPEQVTETYYGITQSGGKSVFSYYVGLPHPFGGPTPGDPVTPGTYWISVEANMVPIEPMIIVDPIYSTVQWGWQESPDLQLSAAVQDFKTSGWLQIQNDMHDNDMAFELITVPEPTGISAVMVGLGGIGTFFFRRRR